MKYTIFGFSQYILIEKGLSLSDASVLRFIVDFYHTGKMRKIIVSGSEFIWINYKYVSNNLPILHTGYKSKNDRANKRRVTECIDSLCSANILEKHVEKDAQGTFVYVRIVQDEYEKLIGENHQKHSNDRPQPNNSEGYHHNGNGATTTMVMGATATVVTKDSSIRNNSSIKNTHTCDFDLFWNLYDKKRNREKCLLIWNALQEKDKKTIIERLPDYIESTPDKRYRKDPENWLKGKCWNDEIIKQKKINGKADEQAKVVQDALNNLGSCPYPKWEDPITSKVISKMNWDNIKHSNLNEIPMKINRFKELYTAEFI